MIILIFSAVCAQLHMQKQNKFEMLNVRGDKMQFYTTWRDNIVHFFSKAACKFFSYEI